MRRFDLRPYRAHITTNQLQIPSYLCVASNCRLCSLSARDRACQVRKENDAPTVSSAGSGLLAPTRALLAKRPKISIRTALDGPQCTETAASKESNKVEAMSAIHLLEQEVHDFLEASLASSSPHSLPITQLASSLPDHLMESEALEHGLRSFLASHPHRYCLTTTSTTAGNTRILTVSLAASSSSDTSRPATHVSSISSPRVVGKRQKRTDDTTHSGVDTIKRETGKRAEEHEEEENADQSDKLSSSLDGVSASYAPESFSRFSSSPYSPQHATKSPNPQPFVPPPAPELRIDKTLSSFLARAGAGLGGEGASEMNLMRAQQVHVAVPPPQSPPPSLCNESPKVRAASVFDEVSQTYTPTKGDNYVCDGGCGVSEVRVVSSTASSAFSSPPSPSAGMTHRQFNVRPSAATNRLARGGVRYDEFTELQREASHAIAKVPRLRLASIRNDMIPRELWGEARLTKLRCCWPCRSERRGKGLVETLLDIQKANGEIPNLITVVGVESPRLHRKQYDKGSHSNSSTNGGKAEEMFDSTTSVDEHDRYPVGLEVLSHAQIFDFLGSSIPARTAYTTHDHETRSMEKFSTSSEPHSASNELLFLRKKHECEAVLSHFDFYARMNPTMISYFTTPKNEAEQDPRSTPCPFASSEASRSADTMSACNEINFRRAEEHHLYRIARFVSALPRGSPISEVALRASSTRLIDPLPLIMYERLGQCDVSTNGNPQQTSGTADHDVKDLEPSKGCTDLTDDEETSGYTSSTFERDHRQSDQPTEAEAPLKEPFIPFDTKENGILTERDLQMKIFSPEETLRSILEEGIYHDVSEDVDNNNSRMEDNSAIEAKGQKTLKEEPHPLDDHVHHPLHPDAMQIFLTAPYLFELLGPKSGSSVPSRYTSSDPHNESGARTTEQPLYGNDEDADLLVPFMSGVENILCMNQSSSNNAVHTSIGEEPNGTTVPPLGAIFLHGPQSSSLLLCSRVSSVRFIASDRYLPDEYCLSPSHLQMAIDEITQKMAEAREEQRERLIQKGKKSQAKMPFDKKVIRYRGALKKLKLAQTVQKCGPSPFVDPHVTAWLIYDLCVEYLAHEEAKERAASAASSGGHLGSRDKPSGEALVVEHCEFVPKGKDAYANAAGVYISSNSWDFTLDHFHERSTSAVGSRPCGILQRFLLDYELRSRTMNFSRAILPLIPAAVTSYSAISLRMLTSAVGLFEAKAEGLDVLLSLRDGFGCTLFRRECETSAHGRAVVRLSKGGDEGNRSPMARSRSLSVSSSSPPSSITAAVLVDGPKSPVMESSVHAVSLHQGARDGSVTLITSSLGSSMKGDDKKTPTYDKKRGLSALEHRHQRTIDEREGEEEEEGAELEDGYSRFTDDMEDTTIVVGSGIEGEEGRQGGVQRNKQIDNDSYNSIAAFGIQSCAEANVFFVDQLSKQHIVNESSAPSRRVVKQKCRLVFGPPLPFMSSATTTTTAASADKDSAKGEEYSLGTIEEERGGGERVAVAATESRAVGHHISLLGVEKRGEMCAGPSAPPRGRGEEGWASVASDHLASSMHALLIVMSRGRTAMSSRSGGECSHDACRSTLRPPAGVSSALSVGPNGSLFVSMYSLSVRMRYSESLSRGLVFGQQVIFSRSGGALPIGLPHSLEHAVIEGMLVRHGDTFQIPTYAEQLTLVMSGDRNEKNDDEVVGGGLSVVSFLRRYPELFEIDPTGRRVRAL